MTAMAMSGPSDKTRLFGVTVPFIAPLPVVAEFSFPGVILKNIGLAVLRLGGGGVRFGFSVKPGFAAST